MSEVLTEIAGVKLPVTAAAAAVAVVVLILFMTWWVIDRKKRTGKPLHAGMLMNGIGFGVLPAMAVWKAFEEIGSTRTGIAVIRPLPYIRWLSEDGFFVPCRIELAAALVCFAGICIWLILRKEALPENGDLLMTGVCIWAVIRLVTEGFKVNYVVLYRYESCAAMLICLAVWTVRRGRIRYMPRRMIADWLTAAVCTAMIVITMNGILTAGSEIGDLLVITGSGLLMLTVILLAGSDLRKTTPEPDRGGQA